MADCKNKMIKNLFRSILTIVLAFLVSVTFFNLPAMKDASLLKISKL